MKKRLILASFILMLIGTAPGYQGIEPISYLPPHKPIYLVNIKLYIDREGRMGPYGTGTKDEWWSEGYIDLVFRLPPYHIKFAQGRGTGTGQRIITGCVPQECIKSYMTYPVSYTVVDYKPYLRVKDWKIIGWKVKIRETWKKGKFWTTAWGTFAANQFSTIPGFHLDTYWVFVPLYSPSTSTSSWTKGMVSWKNVFKVSRMSIRVIGSTGDE
jgi:hypothetical protein